MQDIIYLLLAVAVGALGFWGYSRIGGKSNVSTPSEKIATDSEDTQALLTAQQERERLEAQCEQLSKSLEQEREQLKLREQELEDLKQAILAKGDDGEEAVDPRETLLQSEVARLKKQISRLEEEREDLEDDLKKRKKKQDELKKEWQDERAKTRDLEAQLKTKDEELQTQGEKIGQLDKALELKDGSLRLVEQLLTAKVVDTDKGDQATKRVKVAENIVEFVDDDLPQKLGELELYDVVSNKWSKKNLNWGEEHTEGLRWLAQIRKTWLADKTTVSFIGEFSAGKTSIVRRLIAGGVEDPQLEDILPSNVEATTAIPAYISYAPGNQPIYSFFSPDEELKSIKEETVKSLKREYFDSFKGAANLIKYFVFGFNKDVLKGLSILDTPGFSSNDKEDAERTLEVVNESDALFWVVDIDAGTVNKSSLDLIKKHLTKPLYVILNKVDKKAKSEVDATAKLIQETFQKEGVPLVAVIPYSRKEDIKVLTDIFKKLGEQKTRSAEFIARLQDKLNGCVEELDKCIKGIIAERGDYELEYSKEEENIKYGIDKLKKSANELKEIPTLTSSWFSSDKYQMTVDKHSSFVKLIEEMVGKTSDEKKNNSPIVDKIEASISKLLDVKSGVDRYETILAGQKKKMIEINELQERLQKMNKEFDKKNK